MTVILPSLIISHGHCTDGFAAAWAARRAFLAHGGVEPEIVFVDHQKSPEDYFVPDVKGKAVHLIDFCYPDPILERVARDAQATVVLDHHPGAATAGRFVDDLVYDPERSGAGIAWDHFFGSAVPERLRQPRPWIIDYVEDRDLWRFALPRSRDVNACLQSLAHDYGLWDCVEADGVDVVAERGEWMRTAIHAYVETTKELAGRGRLSKDQCVVPIVNAPIWCVSELVGALAEPEGVAYAVGWSELPSGEYRYSLRSRHGVKVNEIAALYNGGGHPAAAGFVSAKIAHTLVAP